MAETPRVFDTIFLGAGFTPTMTATAPPGGVTINSVRYHGPFTVTVNISVASTTPLGYQPITLTNTVNSVKYTSTAYIYVTAPPPAA